MQPYRHHREQTNHVIKKRNTDTHRQSWREYSPPPTTLTTVWTSTRPLGMRQGTLKGAKLPLDLFEKRHKTQARIYWGGTPTGEKIRKKWAFYEYSWLLYIDLQNTWSFWLASCRQRPSLRNALAAPWGKYIQRRGHAPHRCMLQSPPRLVSSPVRCKAIYAPFSFHIKKKKRRGGSVALPPP